MVEVSNSVSWNNRVLSLGSADVAIALYVFLSVVFEDGSLPTKIARVILVGAAVLETGIKPFKANLVLLWQVCFIVFAAASVTWAFSPDNAERMALTLLANGVCVIALVYLVLDDPARVRVFLAAMIIAPTFLMIKVASDHGLLVYLDSRHAGDTNANIVGMTAAFGFGLAYLSFTRRVLLNQWLAGIFLASNLIVVALSASRKAITMIALVVLIFSWINGNLGGFRRILKVATAVSLGLIGYWIIMNFAPLYQLIGHRMNMMINGFRGAGEVDSSTAVRLSLIERGVGWFQEQPWAGHGADNFRVLMANYYPHQSAFYAHNNFIELLVNYGVVGFVLFYWLYVVIIGTGLKHRSRLNSVQAMVFSLLVALLLMEYGAIDYYSRVIMAFVGVAWVTICTDTVRDNRNGDSSRNTTVTAGHSNPSPTSLYLE